MLAEVDIKSLGSGVREVVEEVVKELTSSGVSEGCVKVFKYPFIPVRIQHIVNELGREGFTVAETLVIDGVLYVVATKRGDKDLKLAVDYGRGRP